MDFRLRVFKTVATQLSFTKAAKELAISQPAITKHIQELEGLYNVKLFERAGGRIKLTLHGEMLLNYANDILSRYEALYYKMELLSHKFKGALRIGASGVIAETIMPSLLADLTSWFPNLSVSLITDSSKEVEKALLEKRIDVGLIESGEYLSELVYSKFTDDELVLVTSTANDVSDSISFSELTKKQLVLQNSECNYGYIFNDIKGIIYLDSINSIKEFVKNTSDKYAFIPFSSMKRELENNELKRIYIEGVEMKRKLEFITLPGRHNPNNEQFISFVAKWYSKN